MGYSRENLYAGTNGGTHGVIEHDCLDCMHSWDLRSEYEDECPKCNSANIVRREAFDFNPARDLHHNYYDGNGGFTHYEVSESSVQINTQYDNAYINQTCWEG